VEDSCEHGDKPSGSLRCGDILECLSVWLLSQRLISVELVMYIELMTFLDIRHQPFYFS
jgi:hypothetical protein